MYEEEIRRAVMAAPRVALPDVAAVMWKAFASGFIDEAQAETLSELVELRKALPLPKKAGGGSKPRSPESIERRRRWAASGRLPKHLAARFTLAEQAVLSVVAVEVMKEGDCRLCVGAIAGKAGVGETSVRNAIREAKRLGLVTVEERRVATWRNLANVVRIVSPEWSAWLSRGGQGGGCRTVKGTIPQIPTGGRETVRTASRGMRAEARGEALARMPDSVARERPGGPSVTWKRHR